jgi:hypothetical protein
VIGLDVGLWSGFKRKMEIAESFAQPVITVSLVISRDLLSSLGTLFD